MERSTGYLMPDPCGQLGLHVDALLAGPCVDVELRMIPKCPGHEEASKLLRTALDDIG